MMQACGNPVVQTPPRQEFSFDAAVTGLAFLAEDTLATGLGDGSVRLIAPGETALPRTVRPHGEGAAILAMVLDTDGAGVVTGGDDGRVARTDARGEVSVLAEFPGRQADVLAVSPSSGLRAAAVGREVRLLDRTGETVGAAAEHPSSVTGLAFNPKGKRLAVSHYGGATLRWTGKLDQGATKLEWRGSHIGVTWSPDGTTVLTAMQERELHGWRLTDNHIMSMAGYGAKVRSMDWLRRPMTLATSGGDRVIAWSFTGGGPMGKPPLEIGSGLGRLVTSVAVHPKTAIVAAGFDEGQVIVCALSRQEKLVRLRWPDWKRVTALAWSGDGSRLAAGTEAGAVSLFDLSKGLSA
ncbi:MAG: WD40 repeat domain-containing protein [Alphaproteobacteria bacterium]|nr:WD40 repeat domain-containing protein [Alphaproteobacteria bacterium]